MTDGVATVPIAPLVSLEYSAADGDGPFGWGWRLRLPDSSPASMRRVPGHPLPARICYSGQDAGPVSMTMDFEYEHRPAQLSGGSAGLRCRSLRVSRKNSVDAAPVTWEWRFQYRPAPASGTLLSRVEVVPVDDATAVATCVREGRYWRISLGARTVLVKHSVGMLHLAVLLANANVDIGAADLAAGVAGLRARVSMTAQPILDRATVQRYRRRLAELQAGSDPDDRAREERDWLVAMLGAGAGLGGSPRLFADSDERARIAVGRALRRAIGRIHDADQVVGEHLRRTVNTGMRCTYLAG